MQGKECREIMFTVTFEKQSSRKIYVAIGVCLLSLAGYGIANGTMSIFTVPITEALGVPRSVYSVYDTFSKIFGVVLSLGFATIYKRIGAKGLALLAGAGYCGQYLCMALATNVYIIWLGGLFSGMGYTFAGTLTIFAVLPSWFPKNVGTLSGLAASMSGVSSSIFITLGTNWIKQYGYRQAVIFELIAMAIMFVIAFFLISTSPDDPVAGSKVLEAEKEGVIAKKDKIGGWSYYKRLFTSPATLMGMFIFFLIGGVGFPFSMMLVPLASTRGFTPELGAAVLAIHYVVLVPGKIGLGYLRDKFGINLITPVLFIFCIASTLAAGFGNETMFMSVGVLWGIGTVVNQIWPPYLMMAALGKYYDPGLVGAGLALLQLGRALGIPLIHLPYDLTGSYNITIILWTALYALLWGLSYVMLHLGKKYQIKRDMESAEQGETTAPVA